MNNSARPGAYTALPDGLYAIVQPTWVAGFVVERHHVTMCAPILRRRLAYWARQARLVSQP